MFKRGKKPCDVLNIGSYRRIDNPTLEDWLSLPTGLYFVAADDHDYNTARWNSKLKLWRLGEWWSNGDKNKNRFPCKPNGPSIKLKAGFDGLVANPGGGWVAYKYIQRIDSLEQIKIEIPEKIELILNSKVFVE